MQKEAIIVINELYMKNIYLLVASGVDLNKDIPSVVVGDGIDGVLDGPVVPATVNINGDFAVADGSNPMVATLGGVVHRREYFEATVTCHCCCMEYASENRKRYLQ